jgi:predicted Zn-dependent protease
MAQGETVQYANAIPPEFVDVPSEWLQLLMQLGYVACGQGKPSQAKTIFDGIAAVRPNSELPIIGLAMALINLGKLSSASGLLMEKARPINPKNRIIGVLMAMIFRMSGEFGASDELLDEVIGENDDPEAVEFAIQLKKEDFSHLRSRMRR